LPIQYGWKGPHPSAKGIPSKILNCQRHGWHQSSALVSPQQEAPSQHQHSYWLYDSHASRPLPLGSPGHSQQFPPFYKPCQTVLDMGRAVTNKLMNVQIRTLIGKGIKNSDISKIMEQFMTIQSTVQDLICQLQNHNALQCDFWGNTCPLLPRGPLLMPRGPLLMIKHCFCKGLPLPDHVHVTCIF
jgi:hypothetical protein